MPDLLTHFGSTYLVFRPMGYKDEIPLMYLGALIPDMPWIANRIFYFFDFSDPIQRLAYLIPFSTPFMAVIAALIIALTQRNTLRSFAMLLIAALFHILLDTMQTRIAEGSLLLYPASFTQYSFGWFWPEDTISYVAVGIGFIVTMFSLIVSGPRPGIQKTRLHLIIVLALIAALFPVLTIDRIISANAYRTGFLEAPQKWEGKQISLERETVISANAIKTFSGLTVKVAGKHNLQTGQSVSIRGYYSNGTVYPELIHYHNAPRDIFSYIALFIFVCIWLNIPWKIRTRFGTSKDTE